MYGLSVIQPLPDCPRIRIKMSLSLKVQEAHYCSLQSQSNVYGLTNVSGPCGNMTLLVASLRGKVISMEFQKTRPVSKEVHFTYIPGDAEIVSIDAFNKCHYGNGVVVGIAFIKASDAKPFLNIYSEWEPGSEFNLDSIAQGCQNLELNFVPYQLYHVEIPNAGSIETVFILSGSDHKLHLYREDRYLHTFSEEPIEDFFPELNELSSCPGKMPLIMDERYGSPDILDPCCANLIWMDCRCYHSSSQRVMVLGCQDGTIILSVVNTATREVTEKHQVQHDGPVTSVKLFNLQTTIDCPSFVNQVLEMGDDDLLETDTHPELHLVVATAIDVTVVYRNVMKNGLSEPVLLPDSDAYDSTICVTVADVDLDGQNEILIGTYGQEILMYKYVAKTPRKQSDPTLERSTDSSKSLASQLSPKKADSLPPSPTDGRSASPVLEGEGEWRLTWQRSFPDPVLVIDVLDITGDGIEEIIVVSLKGLHVLQHDLSEVTELCIERLRQATKQRPQEDVFQQLLQENLT